MSSRTEHVPVLVVGAGPAGLAAAITLSRNGIDSLVVERRRAPSDLPRATSVSTRSMELMRAWGVERELLDGGVGVEWLELDCETLASASNGSEHAVGLPTSAQVSLLSPTAPACVPQDHLEPVLLRQLERLGRARVRSGTEVTGVEQLRNGVRVELRDVASGTSRMVTAQYLIGADGVRSVVRRALGIPMIGPDRLFEAVSTLFHAPLWNVLGDRRYGLYWATHPDGQGIFLPAGRGDRWVYGMLWQPGDRDVSEFTEERLTRRIRAGAGVADLPVRIELVRSFSFAAQIADTFGQGRAFLVGDAAHRVTPRGGTGMNTAIHDGHDLGWKLAWVLRGWADAQLLDSYERERRPVAEHNLARSADPQGSLRDAGHELHADLGGRIPHVWVPSGEERVSTLDLLGPVLTLFTGPDSTRWRAAADAQPLPVELRQLDPLSARAIGIHHGGALLARPDGVPLGVWGATARPAVALQAALAGLSVRTSRREAA